MESVKTPIRAIRAHCLECSAGQYKEVKLCPVTQCQLYPYRLGHRPKANPEEECNSEDVTDSDEPEEEYFQESIFTIGMEV
ncbi:MAG: hypothetical protein II882_02395 [Lachnospiraceae bacterium]|nr:hypothetical protein [Lachnospiraceae bacterium]